MKLVIFCIFSVSLSNQFLVGLSQSRLSNQFLTWEDGGELLFLILGFVYDLWVWRGIGIVDVFISVLVC